MGAIQNKWKLVLAAALCGMIVGCDHLPPEMEVDKEHPYPQEVCLEGLHKWVVADPAIVRGPQPEQSPLQVVVPIRSIYDKSPLHVQYMFEFYDARGIKLGGNAGWKFETLEPRVQTQFSGNAIQSTAVGWRLIVRPAR